MRHNYPSPQVHRNLSKVIEKCKNKVEITQCNESELEWNSLNDKCDVFIFLKSLISERKKEEKTHDLVPKTLANIKISNVSQDLNQKMLICFL